MTNLVWDDSRIDELADLVNNTVWQFLEQFSVDVDAFKVAHLAEVATKEALIECLTDGTAFYCTACQREESICSADPCFAVQMDREEATQ